MMSHCTGGNAPVSVQRAALHCRHIVQRHAPPPVPFTARSLLAPSRRYIVLVLLAAASGCGVSGSVSGSGAGAASVAGSVASACASFGSLDAIFQTELTAARSRLTAAPMLQLGGIGVGGGV